MKPKKISVEEFRRLIKPNEEVSASDSSPFKDLINMPPTGQLIVWHGVPPNFLMQGSVCGTTYVVRHDSNDSAPLNIDAYSFREGSDTLNLEIHKINPKNLEFHWAHSLPEFMAGAASEDIKRRIANIIDIDENNPSRCRW
jgi:hypothetical protein